MKQYIILLQGSFNPVTLAHINALEVAYKYLTTLGYDITTKIIVPTSDKYEWKQLESNKHRSEMLLRSVKGMNIIVSDMETKQTKWIRTQQVIKLFKQKYPDKELLYLCGKDKINELQKWNDPKKAISELKKYCTIVCIGRDSFVSTDEALISLGKFIEIPISLKNTSSTFVRNNITNSDIIKPHIHKDVLDYINKYSLYQQT
jgi:nicotinate (nicotinamide) nucleotide adenylyltransferase